MVSVGILCFVPTNQIAFPFLKLGQHQIQKFMFLSLFTSMVINYPHLQHHHQYFRKYQLEQNDQNMQLSIGIAISGVSVYFFKKNSFLNVSCNIKFFLNTKNICFQAKSGTFPTDVWQKRKRWFLAAQFVLIKIYKNTNKQIHKQRNIQKHK